MTSISLIISLPDALHFRSDHRPGFFKRFPLGSGDRSLPDRGGVESGGWGASVWDMFCRQSGRVYKGHPLLIAVLAMILAVLLQSSTATLGLLLAWTASGVAEENVRQVPGRRTAQGLLRISSCVTWSSPAGRPGWHPETTASEDGRSGCRWRCLCRRRRSLQRPAPRDAAGKPSSS